MTKTALLKTLSILITFAMLLAFLPGGFITASAATASSGKCGANLTWTLEDGVLTISGTGSMTDYTYSNSAPWEYKSFTTVIINNGVTSIGRDAFFGCTDLTSVTIPDSVTSIGDEAFEGCTGLRSVTIPDSVTSIGWDAFLGCTGLTSVTIPASVTSIGGYAFYGCTGLESIAVASGNTVYHSAGNCLIKTGSRILIAGCNNSVIPLDGSVTSIGNYAFYGCTGLTSIEIPSSVTSIGDEAFEGCTGLRSVTIPDSVTSIGAWAFYGCTGLTSVTIPDSVTYIDEGAFCECTGLTSVAIPDSVTSIGSSAFSRCTGLTSVTIPDGVTSIEIGAFYDCTGLTSVTIGSGVKSIGSSAFYNCSKLTSVTIPDSVTSIGGYAFYGCTGLTAYVYRNTYGETYVKSEGIKYDYVTPCGVSISKIPDKLSYIEGKDTFDASGGELLLTYDNGYSTVIAMTADMVSSFDNTKVGSQTLTVTYEGMTATFDVTIVAKSISRIAVTTLPSKLTYVDAKAEDLDVSGGRLTVYYNNDTADEIDLTADMVSGFDNARVGVQTLTVSYGGAVTSFDVEVLAKAISGIAVSALPGKTSYLEAKDELDLTGGAITVSYNDDTSREAYMVYNNGSASLMFTDDFSIAPLTVSGFDNTVAGACAVTVGYAGYSASFDVEIVARELCGISVARARAKTVYEAGEALDLTGARIKLSYNNDTYKYANLITVAGMTRMVIEGESASHEVVVSGFDSSWGGVKTVVIAYEGFEASLDVTVNGGGVKGDADGDGVITVSDALSALRVAARLAQPTPELITCCDIDGDGAITVADALSILRVAARLADSL